ncbi:MAG TPA: hypothetical protein VFF98_06530 [Novosphingobium sp.]|nr:hypothetical protein [Novosphingobium sp.]HZV08312.1 hypothetical protein [Novosphingobium sp.]
MAEAGIGNAGIKAVTLHSRDDEVAIYVAAAEQRRLGKQSIARIAKADVSNRKRERRLTRKENTAK